MGKILEKEGNMILLEFTDPSINNIFNELAQGVSSFSLLGYMNIHTTSFLEQFHHATNLELDATPLAKSCTKAVAKNEDDSESWIFCSWGFCEVCLLRIVFKACLLRFVNDMKD